MNQKRFKCQLFGYNKQEVIQTIENLELIIANKELEIERINNEKVTLTEQNALLTHRVNINQKTNEEIARLALKEASELIEKAKHNANMILKESLDYVRDLNHEIENYKEQAIAFRASVEKMSKDLIQTIDQSEMFYLINETQK